MNEVGFVIAKKDGTYVLAGTGFRTVEPRYGRRRKVWNPGRPFKSYGAAERANVRQVRRNIDGKMRTVTENVGEVVMVKLMVL